MGATDYPILKGVNLGLVASNIAATGWTNGAIRHSDSANNPISPLQVMGKHLKVDLYSGGAVTSSYYASPFNTLGVSTRPTAADYKGKFFHEFRNGGQDDELLLATQQGTTYGWDNLNAYNANVRAGRLNSLAYSEIPAAGITATADNSYLTFTPDKTIDGDNGTYWSHNGSVAAGTSWLKYDLATAKKVSKIRFWQETGTVAVLTVVVTGSNDDSTYTEVGRFKTRAIEDASHLINPTIAYRYYKLSFATTETAWLAVRTVQLFRPIISGEIVGSETTTYANDAAADADTNLPSGSFYMITGARTLYRKP